MATGILIANHTASVSFSYTAQADSKVLIAYGPTGFGQYLAVNGANMYGSVSGANVAGLSGGQWTLYLGVGQTLSMVWPGSGQLPAVVSLIEE